MRFMEVRLTDPVLERFVDDQVKAGNFPNPDAVVQKALARMMEDTTSLMPEDIAEIEEGDKEIDRGEFVDFGEFAARMRAKFDIPK
ncbi:MAG TPA: hypothetical protein VHS31_09405 [Tepidisphaeraceae bacterium]|jgi:Arc/MetJ-type ribon-helix-helix transcriptional regulator|nr:hypothetical protein [Tepidisphaeraceae bacterium]